MTKKTTHIEFELPEFVPTKWNTTEDKQRFAMQFITFVQGDFQRKDFPKWFYNRLITTFGNIAHYDIEGFYTYFFTTENSKVEFIRQTMKHPCYGDPKFTYSDVEKWIQEAMTTIMKVST